MSVKQLDHLNVKVSNLEESIEWYHRVFGFETVERGSRGENPWAILRAGEAMLSLNERPGFRALRHEALEEQQELGISHFALRITDEAAWLATLQEEKLQTYWGSPVHYRHSTSWYVHDPTGYEIEVALWSNDEIRFGDAA